MIPSLVAMDKPPKEVVSDKDISYQDAVDAVAFRNPGSKVYFDQRHKPITFKPGDHLFLPLRHGYKP